MQASSKAGGRKRGRWQKSGIKSKAGRFKQGREAGRQEGRPAKARRRLTNDKVNSKGTRG